MTRVGCYPGSFNPLTVAHLRIAEAAVEQAGVERVDLVVSRVALGKEGVAVPRLDHRVQVLEAATEARPWLRVVVTSAQLLVEVAAGYDVLILGADKWDQIHDPAFYAGDEAARDAAVAALPTVAFAPRGNPTRPLRSDTVLLDLDREVGEVSSTGARAGRHHWMAPEARSFDAATGAWTDPERYQRWLREGGASGS